MKAFSRTQSSILTSVSSHISRCHLQMTGGRTFRAATPEATGAPLPSSQYLSQQPDRALGSPRTPTTQYRHCIVLHRQHIKQWWESCAVLHPLKASCWKQPIGYLCHSITSEIRHTALSGFSGTRQRKHVCLRGPLYLYSTQRLKFRHLIHLI